MNSSKFFAIAACAGALSACSAEAAAPASPEPTAPAKEVGATSELGELVATVDLGETHKVRFYEPVRGQIAAVEEGQTGRDAAVLTDALVAGKGVLEIWAHLAGAASAAEAPVALRDAVAGTRVRLSSSAHVMNTGSGQKQCGYHGLPICWDGTCDPSAPVAYGGRCLACGWAGGPCCLGGEGGTGHPKWPFVGCAGDGQFHTYPSTCQTNGWGTGVCSWPMDTSWQVFKHWRLLQTVPG